MIFRRFTFFVILRLLLIFANLVGLAVIFGDMRLFFNHIILLVILIAQVYELIRYVNKTNEELAKFLLAIKHSDFSINFSRAGLGKSFGHLYDSFTEIIAAYKEAKIEKEAQFQYLRMIVKHINFGIIALENEEDIVLVNEPAEKLLGVEGVRNWRILANQNPTFVEGVMSLRNGGRKLLELKKGGDTKTLSIDVSSMMMLDKSYRVITFQDIKSEIEQKEIEAWHKLIRILTHEIMNSVTPISSLTETMQSMLPDDKTVDISDEMVEDIRFSLKTIQKRSDGLLEFIDNYRKLTKVPTPVLEETPVSTILDSIKTLMKGELEKRDIEFITEGEFETLSVNVDFKQIEQVLINMVTNAMHAVSETPNPSIIISAYQNDGCVIKIKDNGKGIDPKELDQIFVPFFSTKKNGSGIGLSLSKQIMSLHQGTIKVNSERNVGTSFLLRFPSL
ncbi:MAG: ATP-binding protein [Bacteroidota bacterium]